MFSKKKSRNFNEFCPNQIWPRILNFKRQHPFYILKTRQSMSCFNNFCFYIDKQCTEKHIENTKKVCILYIYYENPRGPPKLAQKYALISKYHFLPKKYILFKFLHFNLLKGQFLDSLQNNCHKKRWLFNEFLPNKIYPQLQLKRQRPIYIPKTA